MRPAGTIALAALTALACTPPGGGGGGHAGSGPEAVEPVPPVGDGAGPLAAPLPSCVVSGKLQKLSSLQLGNALRDVLRASRASFALEAAEAALFALPPDVHEGGFHEMDDRVSENHVAAAYNVAASVADAITSSKDRIADVVGPCAQGGITGVCLDQFLATFGRRVYRRPLTDDERELFADVVAAAPDAAAGLRDAIARLLMAPQFLYHFEVGGRPFADDPNVVRLTAFEVASRLAFLFWRSGPDDALLDAAASGELDREAGFRSAVDRVFADARTRETLRRFYEQWLRVEGFLGFLMKERFLSNFAKDLGFEDPNGHQFQDMVDELGALTDHVTWDTGGGVRELLLSDVAPSQSPLLAKLYGVSAHTGQGEPPRFPAGQRAGLLTRAALLVSGDERTSPIHRGGFIRRRVLCDEVAEPDPNALPPGSLTPPPPSAGTTTRQRFTAKTADASCMACHRQINDIGYVLEAYDALGRVRTEEIVYDADRGRPVETLPLDTAAVPRIDGPSDDRVVRDPIELSAVIADSGKVEACLARQYFRFAARRSEDIDADACVLASVQGTLARTGGTLRDAFKRIALSPSFRTRRVAP